MTPRRRRGLTDEDRALWAQVVESIRPLKPKRRRPVKPKPDEAKIAAPEASPPMPPPPPPRPVKRPPVAPVPAKAARAVPVLPPLAPIDRHERRRVVRGTRRIDARIDLHGMRQIEAHGALRGFLSQSQSRGHTIVLVITGKGAPPGGDAQAGDDRGILRRTVPHWLRLPDLRPLVLGFEEAHQGHGGSGALYVRLRRTGRGAGP
jgi:DNA-nicking Smr family endonuclease